MTGNNNPQPRVPRAPRVNAVDSLNGNHWDARELAEQHHYEVLGQNSAHNPFEASQEAAGEISEIVELNNRGEVVGGEAQQLFRDAKNTSRQLERAQGRLKSLEESGKSPSQIREVRREVSRLERQMGTHYRGIERHERALDRAHSRFETALEKDLHNAETAIDGWEAEQLENLAPNATSAERNAITRRADSMRGWARDTHTEVTSALHDSKADLGAQIGEAREAAAKHGIKGSHTAKVSGEVAADAAKGAEKGGLMAFAKNRPLLTAAGGAVIAYAAARALGIIGGGNSQAQQM